MFRSLNIFTNCGLRWKYGFVVAIQKTATPYDYVNAEKGGTMYTSALVVTTQREVINKSRFSKTKRNLIKGCHLVVNTGFI